MLWHFDELPEFARSGHGGFNATSDRGQTRPWRPVGVESVLSQLRTLVGAVGTAEKRQQRSLPPFAERGVMECQRARPTLV